MVNGTLAIRPGGGDPTGAAATSALDDVVDPFSAHDPASLLPGPAERLTLPASGHVATLGPELEALAAAIAYFVAAHG